jgi:hypothetical protein
VDRQPIAESGDEIAEPTERLRGAVLSPARYDKERIEIMQELFGPACITDDLFALRTADLTLNTVAMKAVVEGIQRGAKIEAVKDVPVGRTESGRAQRTSRPQLDVFTPTTIITLTLENRQNLVRRVAISKDLAMVRKRKGNEAAAGQPAIDPTKDEAICELGIRRRRRVGDGLVRIGPA